MLAQRGVLCTQLVITRRNPATTALLSSAQNRRQMLSGAGSFNQPRRGMSISALFGFKWPFGGSDEPSKAGGQQLPVDVLFTSYACVAPESATAVGT